MKQPLAVPINGSAVAGIAGAGSSSHGLQEEMPPEELLLQNCFESEAFVKFQYTMDDLLLAASTASTLFNLLVIFCAFRLFKRSGDTMHVFIINMTFGDLLLTVFCHPNEFLIRKHAFLRHMHLCAIIHFCNWLGLAVSGLSLTLLNVDKLIYFRWPLSYDRTMSKRRAICLCVAVWVISIGFVSYVWIQNIVFVTPDCMLQMAESSKRFFYEIFMILFCVLPVSSSLVVSTYLFRLTRQKLNAPMGPGQQNSVLDMPTFKNKLKSLVFIFATTAWTSFSLLPYRIFNICRIHLIDWPNIGCDQRSLMNWMAWILLYLLTLNPIVNPLITALIYAPYRIHLKKLLLNIPGNRFPYSSYRTGEAITESSHISERRIRRRAGPGNNGFGPPLAGDISQHQQQQPMMMMCGGEDSSTTTSSSSRRPPPIPLVQMPGSNKRDSSSADALSVKSSAKSSNSAKSAAAKFVFLDEPQTMLEEDEVVVEKCMRIR